MDYKDGFKYAVNQVKACGSKMNWLEKVHLGLEFEQIDWVESGMMDFFDFGRQLDLDVAYTFPMKEECIVLLTSWLIAKLDAKTVLFISKATALHQEVLQNLLRQCPTAGIKHKLWCSIDCDEERHKKCVKSAKAIWRKIRVKAQVKMIEEASFGMSFGLFQLASLVSEASFTTFTKMHRTCAGLFQMKVGIIIDEFNRGVLDATVKRLLPEGPRRFPTPPDMEE
ncbi:hypothetical protein V5O48_009433 [Marasmius crinis-equi]|uniref:Uncharacterized protein n=1 Tax=Marasmius crinis-equi TaxID=585013 RepID=A0ABR3FB99_9AGAR